MNETAIIEGLTERVRPIIEQQGLEMHLAPLHPTIPAFSNDRSTLLKACEEASGKSAETGAFATEAPFFSALGIETIVMGAGSIDQAHQPNEYLDVAQIEPSIAIIRSLIHKYCI
jgi:acetylornithine deacetylase